MESSTHKSLWRVPQKQEAFLNFALMGLVSLPMIVWAIIFLLVISMGHGQALMRWVAPPLSQLLASCAAAPASEAAMQRGRSAQVGPSSHAAFGLARGRQYRCRRLQGMAR